MLLSFIMLITRPIHSSCVFFLLLFLQRHSFLRFVRMCVDFLENLVLSIYRTGGGGGKGMLLVSVITTKRIKQISHYSMDGRLARGTEEACCRVITALRVRDMR